MAPIFALRVLVYNFNCAFFIKSHERSPIDSLLLGLGIFSPSTPVPFGHTRPGFRGLFQDSRTFSAVTIREKLYVNRERDPGISITPIGPRGAGVIREFHPYLATMGSSSIPFVFLSSEIWLFATGRFVVPPAFSISNASVSPVGKPWSFGPNGRLVFPGPKVQCVYLRPKGF